MLDIHRHLGGWHGLVDYVSAFSRKLSKEHDQTAKGDDSIANLRHSSVLDDDADGLDDPTG